MPALSEAGMVLSLPKLVGLGAAAFFLYQLYVVVYRLYFHPLAKFPGPKVHAASYLPWHINDNLRGRMAKETMRDMHQEHGTIVRISPNRLAIDGSIGWDNVFASRGARPEFAKSWHFYNLGKHVGIFPARKDDHRRQRRLLSHAFSTAALQEQEVHIKYYVDLFITQLQKAHDQKDRIDIVKWLNFTTFDIIGDLAFADTFGSLNDGEYHPWVALIFSAIKANPMRLFLNHFPLLGNVIGLVAGRELMRKAQENIELSNAKTEKRLEQGVNEARKDFMTYILRHNSTDKGMTHEEILVNSRALIVAGSETTATALSGLFFYLGNSPKTYDYLAEEIRTHFSNEEQITIQNTTRLPYLQACLEEILRVYPPAAITPPRISPGDTVGDEFIPKGTYITIYQWATYHNPQNFANPDLFAPERWLASDHPLHDSKYSNDYRSSFKPFSYGPRDCIGKNLAYAEMRLLFARFFWNFNFSLEEGQEDWMSKQRVFTIYEKSPLMVRLTPAR